jgi:hypothetical protein
MDKTWFDTLKSALDKAKEELDRACYLEDCGGNAGIRKMNANKAGWLKYVVYLAELGLECEKRLSEPTIASVEEAHKTDYQKALMLFQIIKDNPIN